MNSRAIYSLLIALFLCCSAYAQKQGSDELYIDSLFRELKRLPDDTTKVLTLWDISFYYYNTNTNAGVNYGTQCLELAQKIGWQKGMAWGNYVLGENYAFSANFNQSYAYYMAALKLFEEIDKNDWRSIGKCYDAIGRLYTLLNELNKAITYEKKAYETSLKDTGFQLRVFYLGNIANIYNIQNKYDTALQYYSKVLGIFKSINDEKGIANSYLNIGTCYLGMKEYDTCLYYSNKALAKLDAQKNIESIATAKGNIAIAYWTKYNDPKAQKNKDFLKLAISNFEEALEISENIGAKDNIIEFGEILSKAYAIDNNYNKAYSTYLKFVDTRDSVYSVESKIKIFKLETDRELLLRQRD
ncbi:MAG: tetratricopeptide repeat protein, partial [Chitinophagia bacterium]|nr:tetratricopeptide repeat protein [Chitinophagia bacterium]